MFSKLQRNIADEHLVIILAFCAGVGMWVLDAFIDSYIFHETSFLNSIILDVSGHEIYFRLFIWIGFIIFAVIISRFIRGHKKIAHELHIALAVVEEEKARSEGIIAAIGYGISIQDRDFRVLYQNDMHKKMIGDHTGEYCYQAYEKRDSICNGCPVAKVFEKGKVYKTNRSAETEHGQMHVEITASPLRDATGSIVAGIEAVRDITTRVDTQVMLAEQANLAMLTASVGIALTEGKSLREMLQRCSDAFVRHLDIAFCRIWTVNRDENILELQASSGTYTHIDGEHSCIPVGRYKIGRIAEHKDPHISNNIIGDPEVHDQEWAQREGLTAFAGHPLIVSNTVVGVVAMFSSSPFSDLTVKTLDAVSDEIALGIDRKHADEALRHSEEKFRTFFEFSPVGIIIMPLNPDGSPNLHTAFSSTTFNTSFLNCFGYSEDELREKTVADISYPEDMDENVRLFNELISGRRDNYQMEKRYRKKDGTILWGHLNVTLLKNSKDVATHTMTTLVDITDRKMMESLLLQSKQDWEETFNTIQQMITIHDREFNIIRANRAAEEHLDLLSHRGSNGKKCYTYYHGKDAPPSACPSCNCLKTGEPANFEVFEPHFNKYLEISVIPRFDKQNAITGLIHITRDITNRKEAEEELRKHRERLSDLVQERTSALTASNRLLSLEISERKQVEMALRLSESKYRDLYNNAPDLYYTLNKDKIIIDCNDTETRMLGYEKDEIIGRPLADFLSDESKKYLEDDFLKLKEERVLKNRERYFIRKNGSVFPAMINVFAEVDGGGEIVTARAIARDITGLKKTERELRNVNRSLKVLSDFNNALIHVTDESELLNEVCRIIVETGGYTLAWVGFLDNDGGKTIYPAAQSGLDMRCSQTISIKENDRCLISRTVLQGRTHLSRETAGDPFIRCCRKMISMSTLSSAVYIPVEGEKGVMGILCIYARETDAFDSEELDLHEKLAANLSYGIGAIRSNIERKRAEAEALRASHLASLGELAAGVAHEINNPINGIINYAQILSNKYSDGLKEHEITDRIIKEGDRIANIVRSLLSFARDRKEGKREVSIKEIMSDSLALTEMQLKKDGIHLIMNIPDDLPKITAQAQQLEQVFLNLISNARYALNQKYLQGNKNKIFEVTAEHVDNKGESAIRLTFRDRGTGIPSHISNKVIDPFFSTKPTSIGTGLGLSISHGIISNHGGSITIESVEGEFTCVTIELPVHLKEKEKV